MARIEFRKYRYAASESNKMLRNQDDFAFYGQMSRKRVAAIEQGRAFPTIEESVVWTRLCNSIELANEICRECQVNQERRRIAIEKQNSILK